MSTFTEYNGKAVSLKNAKGTMLNSLLTEMTSQGLTLMQNNTKEWILYNRTDDLMVNINEMMYLAKFHLTDDWHVCCQEEGKEKTW